MSARASLATALRVLGQLRRDPRTVALIVLVPCLLLVLLKYVLSGDPEAFARVAGPLVGLFPLIVMFVVTSVTMLRERTTGTLERLMTMPLSKLDLLAGYGAAFSIVAALQASAVAAVGFGALGIDTAGPVWGVVGLAIANALLGMSMGLLASAFARTEFQAVQFMPAFVFPQLLLCGLFAPREQMAAVLEAASYAMPMTYAFDALERLSTEGALGGAGAADLAVTLGVTALALVLAAGTLRRRTP